MTVTEAYTSRPTVAAQNGSTQTVGRFGGVPPLLAGALVLIRVSSLNPATFQPGDDIPNEGTAGTTGRAKSGTLTAEPFPPGAAELVNNGVPGIAIDPDSLGEDFYYIDPIAAIDVDTFTAFAWVTWSVVGGGFSNICSKITGTMGSGGSGWQIVDSSFLGGTAVIAGNAGSSPGTNPAIAADDAGLTAARHLVVTRVIDATTVELFVDGTLVATDSLTAVSTTVTDHEWIFGRGTAQIGHAWGFWNRALTDAEITTTLPTELGAT